MSHSSHRVQGLANDEVTADWPAIDAAELAWLGRRHPALAGAAAVSWHSPRPLSAAAIVEGPGGPVFVKRHHQYVRSGEDLLEEHRFIRHLADAGLPVATLLPFDDGSSVASHATWTYEVHAVGVGEDLFREVPSWVPMTDPAQSREAGRMLARLHHAAAGYDAPQRRTHLLVARDDLIRAIDPLATLHAQLADRPALARYLDGRRWEHDLASAVLPWQRTLPARLQSEPRCWAHNDWHASNLLWQPQAATGARISTVLDFGLASPTSAMFDLATAIERNAIAWLALDRDDAVRIDTALALLAGYREVHPLDPTRVHLLADLLPVVHLDFALSEVEYFEGATRSRANADVAYDTFLLGHARWFGTAPAERLLQALRDAA